MKTKHRDDEELRKLMNRLNRVEGQVRGVKKMLEEEQYCVDILTQVSAIQAALNAFNKELLSSHIHSCVVEEIQKGNTEVVDELCESIKKLMK
ncbi:metal-sensing transcriptional repressor [Faecalicatena contorta]|uniref:Metal-sensing transcriptional repressor n=1 Tax=Faecalicatena fissicatena TaxID=290055 RepID=A0ABS2E8P2_9FIRM|nr:MULTISPECIES: metal-sensing transcriptional repressor [Clostridia]MBM6685057.1 metal-sensing transcriptional repressor [Faecalicatena contorta]MBM6710585.1 metal-sensing transcriptional repressor [Faecalicatena contorta]MBM6738007.1 metal-sensing transcriptional repressor [Faecalicatena fissicatena]